MSRTQPWPIVGLASLIVSACGGGGGIGDLTGEPEPLRPVSVLTYNLYFGADHTPLLEADTMEELAQNVEAAYSEFLQNDFADRANAIADRIAEENPQLVGLQEVVNIYIQPNGDRFEGGKTPATELVINFEQTLMNTLADRGLDYRVAVRGERTDIEVPSASGEDFRLVDHDLILVRGDTEVRDTDDERFTARVPVPTPDGEVVEVVRGFVSAVVMIEGAPMRFVNTHLEIGRFEAIQVAQATELLARLALKSEPIVMVGDFNSEGDPAQSTHSYDLVESAGFTDAWTQRDAPSEPGFTCCQIDMHGSVSQLDQRIDFIWLLGDTPSTTPSVRVIGDSPDQRTAAGRWGSNHAGVAATF
jgi:endonuclease/exonuclease/phosphatase family metal-dependent hydrolase